MKPTPPPAEKSASWLEIPAAAIAPETRDLLTQIDTFTAGKLPRLGLLRFNAKLASVELVELVKEHGETSRKSFENAKPFADVLAAIGSFLPQSAYDAITYREACELRDALTASKKDAVICAKVEKRLKACKFKKGWASSLAELATPPAAETASDTASELATPPAAETASDTASELATPPAAETASDENASDGKPKGDAPPASNIVALPDSAPLSAVELVELVKSKLREMSDKQRDAARAMLASLVNEPAKLAERIAA